MDFDIDYIIYSLLIPGFRLGGLGGIAIGAIASAMLDRRSSLVLMGVGGIIGLLVGFFIAGGSLMSQYGSLSQVYANLDRLGPDTFGSILVIVQFAFIGVAFGAGASSLGNAVMGGITGVIAGTLAAAALILANQQFRLGIPEGPIFLMIVTVITFLFIIIMNLGQTSDKR